MTTAGMKVVMEKLPIKSKMKKKIVKWTILMMILTDTDNLKRSFFIAKKIKV
jgi:hypothetical protein